jgi:hypothetical protein
MLLTDLLTKLESTGMPVAYSFFREPQDPPFLVYFEPYTNNFQADDHVYRVRPRYQVELYTQYKDPKAEENVEDVLHDLNWDKTETFIDSEELFQVVYTIYER